MSLNSKPDLVTTIIDLSRGFKDAHAPPQAALFFQEQYQDSLKFHVVLLRILKPEAEAQTLLELSKQLPANVRFIPERVANVGILDDKCIKEANVFSLEISSELFLRKNHSINLMKAQQFVVRLLEKMVGPFHNFYSCTPLENIHSLSEGRNQQEQYLRLSLPRAAQSLDPRLGSDRTSGIIIKMLYEGLCRIDAQGQVELALASHIEVSEDQKKYLFSLKKTFWSNGSSVTAYDFEYAWKKILEPDFRSPYSFLFFPIKNAEAAKRGEKSMHQVGIQALDDHTLQVQLEYPAPFFLDLTSNWLFFPLCREIDQKHPGWAYHSETTHVCNGPFKLDLWDLNDTLQIIKNPLYWDHKNVKLDRIQVSIIDDEKKGIDLFLQDELDWVGDPLSKIPPAAVARLQSQKMLHTDHYNFGLFLLQPNLSRLPFHNAKIRKAFAYGAHREAIIKNVLYSEDLPAFGFSCSLQSSTHPVSKDGDQESALAFFQEGLDELGMKRSELPPIVISHSEIEEHASISHALGDQWQQLFGVEIKYNRLMWNNFFAALHRNELHIGGLAWYTRVSDPLYFYNLLVSREHVVRLTTWKNPTYSRVIEEAKYTADPEKKESLIAEAENILLDAMPIIPLLYQKMRYIKNPRLHGYILSPTNQIDFRAAYLQEKE